MFSDPTQDSWLSMNYYPDMLWPHSHPDIPADPVWHWPRTPHGNHWGAVRNEKSWRQSLFAGAKEWMLLTCPWQELYESKNTINAYLKICSPLWRHLLLTVINNTSFFHSDQKVQEVKRTVLFCFSDNPLFISWSENIWRQHTKLTSAVLWVMHVFIMSQYVKREKKRKRKKN